MRILVVLATLVLLSCGSAPEEKPVQGHTYTAQYEAPCLVMSQQASVMEEDGDFGRELVIRIPLHCARLPEEPDNRAENVIPNFEDMLRELLKQQEPMRLPERPSTEMEL